MKSLLEPIWGIAFVTEDLLCLGRSTPFAEAKFSFAAS